MNATRSSTFNVFEIPGVGNGSSGSVLGMGDQIRPHRLCSGTGVAGSALGLRYTHFCEPGCNWEMFVFDFRCGCAVVIPLPEHFSRVRLHRISLMIRVPKMTERMNEIIT